MYGDNVIEIDFDALIANETDSTLQEMHEYFASVEPTKKMSTRACSKGRI